MSSQENKQKYENIKEVLGMLERYKEEIEKSSEEEFKNKIKDIFNEEIKNEEIECINEYGDNYIQIYRKSWKIKSCPNIHFEICHAKWKAEFLYNGTNNFSISLDIENITKDTVYNANILINKIKNTKEFEEKFKDFEVNKKNNTFEIEENIPMDKNFINLPENEQKKFIKEKIVNKTKSLIGIIDTAIAEINQSNSASQ